MRQVSGRMLRVLEFAAHAHEGQFRKYTGEPYIVHPVTVAEMALDQGLSADAVMAALLHDVIEDCEVTLDEVTDLFGRRVACKVWGLTNADARFAAKELGMNRALRKAADRVWLRVQDAETRMLKLIDLTHNLSDWPRDDKFLDLLLEEAALLAEELTAQPGVFPVVLADFEVTYKDAADTRAAYQGVAT